ncbi:MAG: hypothetical protein ABL995_19395 [Bryobacteraceae bacterium]
MGFTIEPAVPEESCGIAALAVATFQVGLYLHENTVVVLNLDIP